jgi:hypothetical protein
VLVKKGVGRGRKVERVGMRGKEGANLGDIDRGKYGDNAKRSD